MDYIWAVFGVGSAFASAAILLLQERFKVNGYALAYTNKLMCMLVMLPFVLVIGIPDSPLFYVLLCTQALIWTISDVILLNAIPKIGAGVTSRVLPVGILVTFILWFFVKPELFSEYMQNKPVFAGIFLVLCLAVFFATRLRHCQASRNGFRALWFVLLAVIFGPMIAKIVITEGGVEQAPYAYVFFEAMTMVSLWTIYYFIKKPVDLKQVANMHTLKSGAIIGAISAFMVLFNMYAYFYADNPAYLPAINLLSSVLIVTFYKLTGKKEKADLVAGFGIVFCAFCLVMLKAMK